MKFAESIRVCLQRVLADDSLAAKFELSSSDYSSVEILQCEGDVKFTVFAPIVFATIRTACGISRTEFREDVAPSNRNIQYLRSIIIISLLIQNLSSLHVPH